MDILFKRQLPQCLINFETNEIRESELTEEYELRVNESTKRLVILFENTCIEKDESLENRLIKKTKDLEQLDKKFAKKTEQVCILKTKMEAMKRSNKEMKKDMSAKKIEVSDLQNEVIPLEKEKMEKARKLKKAYKTNRFVYSLYKKFSDCTITFESSQVVMFEFSPGFYVKLSSEDWKSNWYLVDIKPNVVNRKSIEQKLTETDDVQALLANVYKSFEPHFDKLK